MSIKNLEPTASAQSLQTVTGGQPAARRPMGQRVGRAFTRVIGWKIIGELPDAPKYLMIGAPHTSNWDFFIMLVLRSATGVNIHFVGKDSIFHGLMGSLMRKLGGIPVNRNNRSGFVNQIIELFSSQDALIIAIAPEGTRGHSTYWKTGFYYMAVGAGVPIQMIGIDYPTRSLEIGPLLWPSNDIQMDMVSIKKFYDGKRGKFPAKQGMVEIEPTA